MKILVFSDSHNNVSNMYEIARSCTDASLIVHLGDMCVDYKKIKSSFPDVPSVAVKGNNDYFENEFDFDYVANFEGVKCLFTHGHRYSVKGGVSALLGRARILGTRLALFGHTHMPYKEKIGDTLLFNPGSIGCGRPATFGIIHLDNSVIQSADILTYDAQTKNIDFLKNF